MAAAAEQSAVAMREAAQTAAGLIRAIELARGEVEVAAGVATRAAEQSTHAVIISDALSDHAKAIESILGLIRDTCRPDQPARAQRDDRGGTRWRMPAAASRSSRRR